MTSPLLLLIAAFFCWQVCNTQTTWDKRGSTPWEDWYCRCQDTKSESAICGGHHKIKPSRSSARPVDLLK